MLLICTSTPTAYANNNKRTFARTSFLKARSHWSGRGGMAPQSNRHSTGLVSTHRDLTRAWMLRSTSDVQSWGEGRVMVVAERGG